MRRPRTGSSIVSSSRSLADPAPSNPARDPEANDAERRGDDERLRDILREMCELTHMGFAAIARVTDVRWIAVQVRDEIGFGLSPGEELELKTTICEEIRESGQRVVIDDVDGNIEWQMHHTPIMYGFKSYISVPLFEPDGRFFGTLCAIDPSRRPLSAGDTVAMVEEMARRAEAILAERDASGRGDV